MRNRTKPSQVKVPPVILWLQVQVLHLRKQNIKAILSLTASNKFPYARHKQIHSIDCFSSVFVVVTHVKCLDIFRIVVHKHTAIELCLCQPTFVFCGQISPKFNIRELPLGRILSNLLLEVCNGITVGDANKWFVHNLLQPVLQSLIVELGEESQIFFAFLQSLPYDMLQHIFCVVHGRIQISKCHFRLDHVKLCKVTSGLRILSAEGRSKSVNISKSTSMSFTPKLSADSEKRRLSEKILFIIDSI
mmetsp:Transcript_9878/g.14524  ORF Transcript_9878/g.14524 Transcript_9878/m.14524 type:complete len:247 (-) Transcript_9878:324-1064(-)